MLIQSLRLQLFEPILRLYAKMYLCHCQNINTQPAIKALTTKNDIAQRTILTQFDTPYLGNITLLVLE